MFIACLLSFTIATYHLYNYFDIFFILTTSFDLNFWQIIEIYPLTVKLTLSFKVYSSLSFDKHSHVITTTIQVHIYIIQKFPFCPFAACVQPRPAGGNHRSDFSL